MITPDLYQLNPLAQRLIAAGSATGRWWLNLHVRYNTWSWIWMTVVRDLAKRGFDVVVSAFFLAVLSPLFALIALLIRLEDGKPVIFEQIRVGRHGCHFKMYKFRSMRPDAEKQLEKLLAQNHHKEGVTFKIKDDPRLTRVGKWLRKFSFDELPQFYNVFRGDMSLVGPRPPVPREVALYTLADRRRLAVKPGITCFWQIGGRAEIDFSGQVDLDVQYIEQQSLFTDVKILVRTVPAVLSGKGAC
ncbi:MAG TPA: sugar transferase [Desulfuromonadaceae bacterium]|nr:sugar transferase [Desulfuromonadaceae bacterium]